MPIVLFERNPLFPRPLFRLPSPCSTHPRGTRRVAIVFAGHVCLVLERACLVLSFPLFSRLFVMWMRSTEGAEEKRGYEMHSPDVCLDLCAGACVCINSIPQAKWLSVPLRLVQCRAALNVWTPNNHDLFLHKTTKKTISRTGGWVNDGKLLLAANSHLDDPSAWGFKRAQSRLCVSVHCRK
jgi:hypothetical protein